MQEDLDKKLIYTADSDTTVTVPENISGWAGNLIIQPHYEPGTPGTMVPPGPPKQTKLVIKTEYQLFITELNNGHSSYDGMPINGEVHIENSDTHSHPVTLRLITYYLNMGFVNNKVYIQGLTGLRI